MSSRPEFPDPLEGEDRIAGHLRRYTFAGVSALARSATLAIRNLRGLFHPLSNLLLPVFDFLVRAAETHQLNLTSHQRTIESGARDVPFKTKFPSG